MFRSLPVHSIREQHHEPAFNVPFSLSAHKEVIDDDLRAIREIAKLAFPANQEVGNRERIAVVEPENTKLSEMRVRDDYKLVFFSNSKYLLGASSPSG
jgi:hypothetical protein